MDKAKTTKMNWYEINNAGEVPSPALLVYPDRIRKNIQKMIEVTGGTDRLRPHVKTHKMPEIIKLQMEAGIGKFKCATISEVEMVASCGAKDILLAIQPVGPNVGRLFQMKEKFPETDISCIADSENAVRQLSDMAVSKGTELKVWLDINNGMNRSGILPGKEAAGLAIAISKMPSLKLEGLHVYDGHIRDKDFALRQAICDNDFLPVTELIDELSAEGIADLKIVAGGTSTFPIHALRPGVQCSPGTPVLWDLGYSRSFPDLEFLQAAILLTRIISKPAKDLLSLDLGHKAVASEMPHPRIMLYGLSDYTFTVHSEEHLVITLAGSENMKTGDCFYAVPWHICPTVDRFDTVFAVRQNKVEEQWKVTARNRKISI